MFERLEVLVDGGIRRGTDVLKCVCLGAKAVGLGRPPLFALEYGQEGVEHLVDGEYSVVVMGRGWKCANALQY